MQSAMNVERVEQRRPSLRDRVAHAYYDYGRLCAAHPAACLSISIVTIVLLSYPVIVRFKLPASSPMDVHWNEKHFVDEKERAPEWLYLKPSVYVQQIIVRSRVHPWNVFNLTSEMAVKGPLSRSFHIERLLQELRVNDDAEGLRSVCSHVHAAAASGSSDGSESLLPSHGCLVLSPTLFWANDEERFFRDDDILSTIFEPSCTQTMCVRELFLGMPTRMTGIKRTYQTNRHRSIDYSITVFYSKYSAAFAASLRRALFKEFEVQKSRAADDSTFVHVFYRPRKYIADYFPLVSTYVLLMFYIYFSASKIVMVKSKWGLALAGVVTVATTLSMTTGICTYLELMPTLYGAELFPYLALIVGLENTLCLTKSVVYTPPSMDVPSRLAHGLSQEGFSFTKYFLLEMTFLAVGFITFVPEIQEFCTFAFIGLVIDFYMQLFFYMPCLTFDLYRLGREDKQRFSLMLFKSDIRHFKTYPNLTCPLKRIWPRLFENKVKLFRVKSDPQLRESGDRDSQSKRAKGHRRAASAFHGKGVDTSQMSARIRLLYFWTRTRIVQRAVMVLFVVWTIWLGFIVHKWRITDTFASGRLARTVPFGSFVDNATGSATESSERFGVSHRVLESAPLQWGEWQRRTFKWWPVLFSAYNLSLSGHYITYLPPIVLSAIIPPNDPSIAFSGGGEVDSDGTAGANSANRRGATSDKESLLNVRIYNLETQMTIMLVITAIFIFSTVAMFILYACFSRRVRPSSGSLTSQEKSLDSEQDNRKSQARSGCRSFIESAPIMFSGHSCAVECVGVMNPSTIVSSCLDSEVIVWDAIKGEKKMTVSRSSRAHGGVRPPNPGARSATEEAKSSGSLRHRTVPGSAARSPFLESQWSLPSTSFTAVEKKLSEKSLPQIWCMAVKQSVIVLGCSDGSLEIVNADVGNTVGVYKGTQSCAPITHVQIRGGRVALIRLDGCLEFLDIRFSLDRPFMVEHIQSSWCGQVHRKVITRFESSPLCVVTASHDGTLKVFEIRSARLKFTLQGHNAPIFSVCVDAFANSIYSSCEDGIICIWDIEDGRLMRTIDEMFLSSECVELAFTSAMLLGYSSDGHLWIWDKMSTHLHTRITPECGSNNNKVICDLERRCVVAVNEQIAATGFDDCVLFWDLRHKIMVHQIRISGSVDKLIALDERSVVCCSGNHMYRINVPAVSLK